jgi:hypothetical protein
MADKTRFFVVEPLDGPTQLVVVEPSDEKVWEETQRYLKDAEVTCKIYEVKALSPGGLSDLLAPRDD